MSDQSQATAVAPPAEEGALGILNLPFIGLVRVEKVAYSFDRTLMLCPSLVRLTMVSNAEHVRADFNPRRDGAQVEREIGWWFKYQSGSTFSVYQRILGDSTNCRQDDQSIVPYQVTSALLDLMGLLRVHRANYCYKIEKPDEMRVRMTFVTPNKLEWVLRTLQYILEHPERMTDGMGEADCFPTRVF